MTGPEPARRPRIFVVDDHADNVEILEDYLCDDFDVGTAEGGEQALERIGEFAPDVLLLDIMMPGIDGYEVCRRLRERPDCFDLKIILLSAKVLLEDRLAGYEAGADDYLTKPFDEGELRAKINVYLRLRRMEETDRLKSALISVLAGSAASRDDALGDALADIAECDLSAITTAVDSHASGLTSVMEKTLRLVALRSGYEIVSRQGIELRTLIDDAIDAHVELASPKSIGLISEVPLAVTVSVDARLTAMALNILLRNAVRASPFHTDVVVSLSAEEPAAILVTDSGSKPAAKSSAASLRDEADINLAIVDEIARAHGGELTWESVGERNTFRYELGSPCVVTHLEEAVV